MNDEIPRRNRIDLFSPAEKAIWEAMGAVEAAGAHSRLTDAVVLLGQAKDAVADFVDEVPEQKRVTLEERVAACERRLDAGGIYE